MQLFEGIVLLIEVVVIVLLLSNKATKKIQVIGLFSIVILLLIIQIIFGYIRWQFFPLYIAIVLIGLLLYFREIIQANIQKAVRVSLIMTISILVFLSTILVLIFPMYDIPSPSGDYFIGTNSYVLQVGDRQELYSDEENDLRKIKIQFWYPAETIDGYEQAPWLDDGVDIARGLSKDMNFPFFALDHTAKIMSNSYIDAPISTDLNTYPVVVISHGWRGFRNVHTDYAEELASLGYIVVGIDHTYGSVATVFDDEVIYLNEDALPERETTPDFLNYANQLVGTYASDISVTLDYLEAINDVNYPSMFSEKIDVTKIGLLGHSTGGGADVEVALHDSRITSVIGLDAWVEPITESELTNGLTIPSLFLRSESWETGFNNEALFSLINNSTIEPSLYQIQGTTHFDFAMVYMYSPLTKYIGFSGEIDSEYLNDILKTMITTFFDRTLKDDQNSVIDSTTWEEVVIVE